jgi:hypothetical protein
LRLPCACFVGLRDELPRIHRVEKEAAIAFVPKRLDDMIDKERRPFGLALIDHARCPRFIASREPAFRQIRVIAARRQHFADAGISEPRGMRQTMRKRIETAVGFDNGRVECRKHFHGRRLAVIERK